MFQVQLPTTLAPGKATADVTLSTDGGKTIRGVKPQWRIAEDTQVVNSRVVAPGQQASSPTARVVIIVELSGSTGYSGPATLGVSMTDSRGNRLSGSFAGQVSPGESPRGADRETTMFSGRHNFLIPAPPK